MKNWRRRLEKGRKKYNLLSQECATLRRELELEQTRRLQLEEELKQLGKPPERSEGRSPSEAREVASRAERGKHVFSLSVGEYATSFPERSEGRTVLIQYE